MTRSTYSRRSFLVTAAAAVGGSLVSCASGPELSRSSEPLFTLGIASDDPEADGVVLWTHGAICGHPFRKCFSFGKHLHESCSLIL
jgi:phosphodiesterase/alkaline phosphatase D-like protein